MSDLTADKMRDLVREHYAAASTQGASCAPACCGAMPAGQSLALGYTEGDLTSVPDGADLGLGCGNPNAIAALSPGETVPIWAGRRLRLLPRRTGVGPPAGSSGST